MANQLLTSEKRTVADPRQEYSSSTRLWKRNRAACNGDYYVKAADELVDSSNMLLPFSPSMTQKQYDFYKNEAEYPGLVAQYAKMLVSGLLRKPPQIKFPDSVTEEMRQWILGSFCQDGSSLISFLDQVLWEEIQTSRAWVHIDYPEVTDVDNTDFDALAPYPVIWAAESVINWKVSLRDGKQRLTRVIVRMLEEIPDPESEFHDKILDTVYVHEIVNNHYQVRKFQLSTPPSDVELVAGERLQNYGDVSAAGFVEIGMPILPLNRNMPMDIIPAWPLNGSIGINDPILTPLVDREIGLYNKISRRNHLLYGACSYTPVIFTNMSDEDFETVVEEGLGSWMKLAPEDKVDVMTTPTTALVDLDRAIAQTIEEMARMGIRMLAPEVAQAGIALDIRNAGQVAQLSSLNTKASATLAILITHMLNFRYGLGLKPSEIPVQLSADFEPSPLGADWLRLITEWYQQGLIPRSLWITILKGNDIMPSDYDDEISQGEINADPLVFTLSDQLQQNQAQLDAIKNQN